MDRGRHLGKKRLGIDTETNKPPRQFRQPCGLMEKATPVADRDSNH